MGEDKIGLGLLSSYCDDGDFEHNSLEDLESRG